MTTRRRMMLRDSIAILLFAVLLWFSCPDAKGQYIPNAFDQYKDTMVELYPDIETRVRACAQAHQESAWKRTAKSPYAYCLAQFTPPTAGDIYPAVGCTVDDLFSFDADCSLKAQREYMRRLLNSYDGETTNPYRFAWAAYNGGAGWIRKERAKCARENGCNPRRWYRHVEKQCIRAEWACRENRAYVVRIESHMKLYQGVF